VLLPTYHKLRLGALLIQHHAVRSTPVLSAHPEAQLQEELVVNTTAAPRQIILIVDDQPDNINLVAGALSKDFDVQFALGGRQALELIATQPPDLLLLDIMMPDIDGLETLRQLRATPLQKDVPVILLTADDRSETHIKGLDLGADDFLVKPLVLPVLQRRIRNTLDRRALLNSQTRLLQQVEAVNHELARVAELNALLLASAGEGIFSVDNDGNCTTINPLALNMLGYAASEIIGHNLHAVFHHHHADGRAYPAADCPLFQTLRDRQKRTVEDCFIRKDGSLLPVQLTVTPMWLDDAVVGAEVLFQDIRERQRLQRELQRLANSDPLTGINNRRRTLELFDLELQRVRRYGHATGLLMLDLDQRPSTTSMATPPAIACSRR
jgi:PAS domain S-box-containing protein